MPIELIRRFLNLEAASGIILFAMAIIAMVWANSPFADSYQNIFTRYSFLINEGLMSLFFLIVGIELKRAFIEGELTEYKQVILPLVAAIGGMVVPAIIYWSFTYPAATVQGWAIPVATDIAFALGVLALFGKRIPTHLKLFLMMLAIFDDVGAIIIIAVFYVTTLSYLWLIISLIFCLSLFILNRFHISLLIAYLFVGVMLWIALLKSGIHPTLAGVLLAFTLPNGQDNSVLYRMEELFHPWVAYLIMPIFALVNAGVSVVGQSSPSLDSVFYAIVAGLFLGKQIGVFSFAWVLIKMRLAELPKESTWLMFYGITILCGIGFTMSLFLGTLSFGNSHFYLAEVRLGVLVGSILSGLFGSFILLLALVRKKESSYY